MKSLSRTSSIRRSRRGMTLVEIMIAMSLAVAVGGMAIWFMVQSTRTSLRTLSNVDNDLEQWSISNRLLIDSKLANAVSIYSSFEVASFTSSLGLGPGYRGNFLVLSQSDQPAGSTTSTFTNLWGFVYNPATKVLSKFDYPVTDAADAGKSLDQILTDRYAAISLKLRIVARDVSLVGDATGVDGLTGAFLCREQGRQGNLVFRRSSGTSTKTKDNRMFEISFYTRK